MGVDDDFLCSEECRQYLQAIEHAYERQRDKQLALEQQERSEAISRAIRDELQRDRDEQLALEQQERSEAISRAISDELQRDRDEQRALEQQERSEAISRDIGDDMQRGRDEQRALEQQKRSEAISQAISDAPYEDLDEQISLAPIALEQDELSKERSRSDSGWERVTAWRSDSWCGGSGQDSRRWLFQDDQDEGHGGWGHDQRAVHHNDENCYQTDPWGSRVPFPWDEWRGWPRSVMRFVVMAP